MTGRRVRTERRWRRVGIGVGRRSHTVLAAMVVLGLGWLCWPVWDSTGVPARGQVEREAPWLSLALVSGLAALAAAIWRDAGRRSSVLAPVVGLIAANTLLRAVLTPASSGVEFVHALPLLAGAALGAPSGFLVGAGSALLSTVLVGVPAATLPSQALIWGLSGMLGGLLYRLRPGVAWLAAIPLAVLAGVLSGVLLNLMGWGQEVGTTTTSFYPGLPPGEVLSRLWAYTAQTSLVYDTTRGVCTALVVLLLGRPVLRGLRDRSPTVPVTPYRTEEQVDERALRRREDRTRLDRMWNEEN